MHWSDKYPHMLYTSVLLLDGKIENWKTDNRYWENPYVISGYWKIERMKDYKIQWIGWLVKNDEEHEKVFNELLHKWLKQWQYAKDYKLMRDR